jgi:hypothetical protein
MVERSITVDRNVRRLNYNLGRSVRSYREFLNTMLRQAMRGERPFDDCAKAAAAIKPAVEMFLAEKQLIATGGDIEADLDPMAIEDDAPARTFKRVTVTARTGVDKHGAVVDDKTVKIEASNHDAADVIAEAEIRTLE